MSQPNLPAHASIVVVGGGAMGCSTLYHLAKAGVSDAILIERNKLTSGTTWHSAAQVRALRSTRNLTDLIRYSISLYSELEAETGQATGWINKGSLSIATNAERLIHIQRQEALARLYGVRATSVSADEAKERWPLMNAEDVVGAVWSPDDGRVSPSDLCAALIKGARSRGASVFEDTGVTGIVTDGGRVTGLETTRGLIKCDAVALCTGLWSREAAAMAGAAVPVWPCEHFYLLTKPVDGITGNMPSLSDHDSHLYIRDDSGGLLVGCFEPMGKPIAPETIGHDFAFQLLPEDWEHFEPMMMNALHRLPILEKAEVKMLLNGPESFTPDGAFLLGETAETQGLFLGCGMNSVGLATAGGAGMALAHALINGAPPMDLCEADPKRFAPRFNSVEVLTQRAPEVLGKHYEITFPARQWSSARGLRQTPLHDRWIAARAHFGQVYDWERPLFFEKTGEPRLTFGRPEWFDQVGREVAYAHEHAAIFEQSTFGKIEVRGRDAAAFLNRVCCNQMDRPPGRAIYTVMVNERGGVESDLTAVRLAADHYRLYVGTTAIRRDLSWLQRHRVGFDVALADATSDYAVIALMGPRAPEIAVNLGADELNKLGYFRAGTTEIAGSRVLGVRLSYVGETGWELTCRADAAATIFDALQAEGARPAGSLAQSAMRIEKRFLAYGHELDTDIDPLAAGLGFAVAWDTDFIGRAALTAMREGGQDNRLVSIVLDDEDGVPLGNEPVFSNGQIVGKTTSAAFGYRIGRPVAIANITDATARQHDAVVTVDIAGSHFSGRMATGAAFDPHGQRMRGGG